MKCDQSFIYLFIPSFGDCTYRSDRLADLNVCTSNDADLRKDVPFGGFVDIAAHSGGHILPKPLLFGCEWAFSSKCAKYSNFHVINTTAWMTAKFCTMIKTTKYPLWVVQICP